MGKNFDIFVHDLVPEKQKELLAFLGVNSLSEGNYDAFPLTTITIEDEEDEDVNKE